LWNLAYAVREVRRDEARACTAPANCALWKAWTSGLPLVTWRHRLNREAEGDVRNEKKATDPTEFTSRQRKLEGRTMGIFYLVDDPTDGGRRRPERKGRGPKPRRRIIIEAVHPGHPKQTERKRG
jgi:hypothetical protein